MSPFGLHFAREKSLFFDSEARMRLPVLIFLRTPVFFSAVTPSDSVAHHHSVPGCPGADNVVAVVTDYAVKDPVYLRVTLSRTGQRSAVQCDLRHAAVAIDRYGGLAAFAVGIAALRHIEHRLPAPIGLVPELRVPLLASVKAHESLQISACHSPSAPHRTCDGKDVPEI